MPRGEGGAQAYDLRHSRGGSSALLGLGLIQQVWRERVELSQLVEREVPFDLLLVHHSVGQGLFGHLPVVDLFLHGSLQVEQRIYYAIKLTFSPNRCSQSSTKEPSAYLSQEAIDEHGPDLAEAVHPVHALHVVRRVPGRVKDDHPAGGDQVDAERAGSGGDEEHFAPEGKDARLLIPAR